MATKRHKKARKRSKSRGQHEGRPVLRPGSFSSPSSCLFVPFRGYPLPPADPTGVPELHRHDRSWLLPTLPIFTILTCHPRAIPSEDPRTRHAPWTFPFLEEVSDV